MDCKNHTWKIKAPIFVNFKKHYCPRCKMLLKVVKAAKIVRLGSHEAEVMKLDGAMIGGVYQSGNVKVHWKEFECPRCGCRFSVEEMKKLEGYPEE